MTILVKKRLKSPALNLVLFNEWYRGDIATESYTAITLSLISDSITENVDVMGIRCAVAQA